MNPRQRQFVLEYLIDYNASKAAERAGFSKKSSVRIGHELLQRDDVKGMINESVKAREQRLEITVDMIVKRLWWIANGNVSDLCDVTVNGMNMKDWDQVPAEKTYCVSAVNESIGAQGGGSKGFKMHDKNKALELLGRHLGAWNDKIKIEDVTPIKQIRRLDGTIEEYRKGKK